MEQSKQTQMIDTMHGHGDLVSYDLLPCAYCIIEYDDCLRFISMNQHMCNLFGFQHKDEYDDLKSLLSAREFHSLLKELHLSIDKGIHHVRFTSRYLLNQQLFQFAYEGTYVKETNQIHLTITDITPYRDLEQELNYIHQQQDILIKQTGHIITHYDILTRTLYQPKEAAEMFGLPRIIENVPYSTVDKIIAEESREAYINFYVSIMKGEPHRKVTVRGLNSGGTFSWYVMQYDLIYDEDHRPVRAIISYEDITDLQEKELAYKKWQCYFQSQQEKSIAYYEYNLTKEYFVIMEAEASALQMKKECHTFQDLIQYICTHVVAEEDQKEYQKLFCRQRLLKEFYEGKREYQFEHRRIRSDGTMYWALAIIQLVSDPYTDDVLASILIEDIDDEKQSLLQLRHLSRIDPLTGLLNRSAMISEVNDLLQNSCIDDRHVLLMIDLDDFKRLNDTMGHKFGDQVLLDVAKELRRAVRTNDLCARLGGDEFIVLLKHTPIDEQLLHRVKVLHHCISQVYGSIQTSTSIGLSMYPNDGWTFDDLYQKADIALYQAKRNGRNQFAVYDALRSEKQE